MKNLTFAEAINMALQDSMKAHPQLLIAGLGINDPGRFFGTTKGLVEEFGVDRVFETPTSENAMAGIAVGAALAGFPVIHMHQRLDFFLLAMDQLVNSAAKWQFMFGEEFSVPVVFRLIVGRGWGQGPTHSQNLKAWFAHVPGLRVFEPSNPGDAYHLMREAALGSMPTIFLEHRWLHSSLGELHVLPTEVLSSVNVVGDGNDISFVCSGVNVSIAMEARKNLAEIGVDAQVLDVRKIDRTTSKTLAAFISVTRRAIVIDDSHSTGSYGASLISELVQDSSVDLISKPALICKPPYPEPMSKELLHGYYPSSDKIYNATLEILRLPNSKMEMTQAIDQPNSLFLGPF